MPESFQRLARRDAELGLDQIDARDLLGDGVLDLDARVAFDEEIFAALRADQELDGAGVHIAGLAREANRVVEDASPQARVEPGAGAISTTF